MSRGALSLLSLALIGCAHAGAPAESRGAPPAERCAGEAPSEHAAALYDLSFRLRTSGESGAWTDPARELHAFSLGPWECALGAEQTLDRADEGGVRLERSRRLACTHPSGATVQTELRCAIPEPLAPSAAAASRRELAVALSAAPALEVACELREVERLELPTVAGARSPLCLVDQTVAPCPSDSSATPERAAR